jgi:hypothetical protein
MDAPVGKFLYYMKNKEGGGTMHTIGIWNCVILQLA